jgi:MSHA pilin protein MshD
MNRFLSAVSGKRGCRGLTLIELIIFIVVIGIGLTGILVTYNVVVSRSADPMQRKQALSIAESLLAEIGLQAFTWCDPQDPRMATAGSYADCATPQNIPTSGETRSGTDLFDNVIDYDNYSGPASDLMGNTSPALSGYTVSVAITQAGNEFSLPSDAVLRIKITVTGHGEAITLTGYRTRHAPNMGG